MKTAVIFHGINKGVDKIEIKNFSLPGTSVKALDNPKSIHKIIGLLQQPFEKCRVFVDSPQLRSFRIELFRQGKVFLRIPVAGNFVKKGNDWYFASDGKLLRELVNQTEKLY